MFPKKQHATTGAENVMQWYEQCNRSQFWSLWSSNGKNLLYSWVEDDAEKGAALLEYQLKMLEETGVQDGYVLKLHKGVSKKDGEITNASTYYASLFFRPVDIDVQEANNSRLMPMGGVGELRKLMEENNELRSRIAALEDEEGDEHDSEPENPIMGAIAGIAQNPQVQQGLVTFLTNLANKYLTPGTPAPAINGVPDLSEERTIRTALTRLQRHVPDLTATLNKLADFADRNPDQFKAYITML